MNKTLIVYYSRKGENYWNVDIKDLPKGNTEVVAEMIQEITGGDLFEVETVNPYAKDYHTCTEEAKKELQNNDRPELKAYLDNLEPYDTIFVGFPNWWGTMPMAMVTFLEHYDLSGKRILPFCTNEGSGMGNSERDLKKICEGALVERGLPVRGTQAVNARKTVETWVNSFG